MADTVSIHILRAAGRRPPTTGCRLIQFSSGADFLRRCPFHILPSPVDAGWQRFQARIWTNELSLLQMENEFLCRIECWLWKRRRLASTSMCRWRIWLLTATSECICMISLNLIIISRDTEFFHWSNGWTLYVKRLGYINHSKNYCLNKWSKILIVHSD
jgi:hypothetical protein